VGVPLEGHTGVIFCVAFSPDGKWIISGSQDMKIQIWDAKTHKAVGVPYEGHIDSIYSVAFSPDSKHIISGSADNTI
jgi:WD40 repeat protein